MKTGFRAEGFDETDRNLKKLGQMANPAELRDLGVDALQPVADTARGLVRSRTGRLRSSIGVGDKLSPRQASLSKQELGTVEVYVGPGALVQAITEEFGTVHERGHPFLRPAWDSRLGEVIARLRKGASEMLRRNVKD